MKKLGILFFTIALMLVSSCRQKSTQSESTFEEKEGLVTYQYKVAGLADTVVSDSIWKIIFQVEGIDKMIISKDDSSVVFTVESELVNNELLMEEIEKRGGELLVD
jgi:hypothetical protein